MPSGNHPKAGNGTLPVPDGMDPGAHSAGGGLPADWPSPRYHELVAEMGQYIGREVYLSGFSFPGGFVKEGQPYLLQEVVAYPTPGDHPHPAKRAYPHMLVLESVPPPGADDRYWRPGRFHGGAVNLAHVAALTTAAFPQAPDQFLFANLQLLAQYHGVTPRHLLAGGTVPAAAVADPGTDPQRLAPPDGGEPGDRGRCAEWRRGQQAGLNRPHPAGAAGGSRSARAVVGSPPPGGRRGPLSPGA